MNDEGDAVRKARKLRVSRDQWKQRSIEKQQQIRQLRVSNRDLRLSREHWKQRVKDLEQQLKMLQAAHDAHSSAGSGLGAFWGVLMPQMVQNSISLLSD